MALPTSPKPSQVPEAVLAERPGTASAAEATPTTTASSLPEPLIRLELRNLRHPSSHTFLKHTNAAEDVADLVRTVLRLLYQSDPHASGRPHIPGTRSITFVVREIDGVAYTTGLELDNDHKEIHISLSYIDHVRKTSGSPDAIRKELMGVMCHELVHCWQHNAHGTAPGGLIEGIADWVRLRAGFVPPHWKREGGDKWDAGYQTTGYFLEWIETYQGTGSVKRLNEALRDDDYDEDKLWKGLFGHKVDELWAKYCKWLEKS